MSRFTVSEVVKNLFIVEQRGVVFGHVARGDLRVGSEGYLEIRGRHWVVIGYEYLQFRKMDDAVEALAASHRHIKDASNEIMEVKRLEGLVPIYIRVSRHSNERSVKTLTANTKRILHEKLKDHHQSLKHAGISQYIH